MNRMSAVRTWVSERLLYIIFAGILLWYWFNLVGQPENGLVPWFVERVGLDSRYLGFPFIISAIYLLVMEPGMRGLFVSISPQVFYTFLVIFWVRSSSLAPIQALTSHAAASILMLYVILLVVRFTDLYIELLNKHQLSGDE